MDGDVGIALRVKDLVIDPVQNPVQLLRVASQQLVETLAVLRGLDLRRVSLADGVHDVSEVNPTPEGVDDIVEPRDSELDQAPLLQSGEHQGPEPEDSLR